MATIKGLQPNTARFDGSPLRIAIVHARWNQTVIDALVEGAVKKLKEAGVKDSNIVIQSVPGSFELPLACSRCVSSLLNYHSNSSLIQLHEYSVIAGSHVQAGATATDLLGGLTMSPTASLSSRSNTPAPTTLTMPNQPFDAVIAIGVLIKGSTMHFEYICDSVSHALMRCQMDTGIPVIFGVLTALNDDQALERAGLGRGESKGHNHGEDWGAAAVEMASHTRRWGQGQF